MQPKRYYYANLPRRGSFLLGSRVDRLVRAYPSEPPPEWRPLGFVPGNPWRGFLRAAQIEARRSFAKDVTDLFEHFDIDASAPGAWRDLALSLAFRHERHLILTGERFCFAALCQRYGVNPDGDDDCVKLALDQAKKYVWDEIDADSDNLDDWGTRLSSADLACLVMGVVSARAYIGTSASVRKIAALLQDRNRLQNVVPKAAAESIQLVLARRANIGRDGLPKSPDSWLRHKLIPQIEGLPAALRSGGLSRLQMQLWLKVLPTLFGQMDMVRDGRK
jgi:hypothetical protein